MFVFAKRFLFFKNPLPFKSLLLRSNKTNLRQIYNHPFNLQLFAGTLSPKVFGRYLRDDYFYLHRFSSVLQRLSERTAFIDPHLAKQLAYLGQDLIAGELKMQLQYREHLKDPGSIKPGAAISAYVDYLEMMLDKAPNVVTLSAILPCFLIYQELGMRYKKAHYSHQNPYKQWLATYSSPDFINTTQNLTATVTQHGNQSSFVLRLRMQEAFKQAIQFELDFFDEVCGLEKRTSKIVPLKL